ncbi:MAG TPA: SEC59/DGK1/VTE5 family protein [Acidobacteriota bacterium]|nr:SEC59/DGK1/VTE5 family protein [Acidobacteriota bacterium]
MPPDQPLTPEQLPYSQELARKATHMAALVIPGGYYVLALEKGTMLAIMIPVAVLMLLIDISRLRNWAFYRRFAGRLISPLIRSREHAGDFSGATYILLSVCATVALYEKHIAIAALAFIVVGDTLAAVVGRKLGRHKFGRKSVEGSLACLAGTLAVAFVVPGLDLTAAVFGAVVATVVEALSSRIDDNVSVPIISGLAMTLLGRIFARA